MNYLYLLIKARSFVIEQIFNLNMFLTHKSQICEESIEGILLNHLSSPNPDCFGRA
jgi:hypothetical protein